MSWEELAAIWEQNARDADRSERQPPVACPNDGTVLDNVHGKLHCPFDGWVWDGNPVRYGS